MVQVRYAFLVFKHRNIPLLAWFKLTPWLDHTAVFLVDWEGQFHSVEYDSGRLTTQLAVREIPANAYCLKRVECSQVHADLVHRILSASTNIEGNLYRSTHRVHVVVGDCHTFAYNFCYKPADLLLLLQQPGEAANRMCFANLPLPVRLLLHPSRVLGKYSPFHYLFLGSGLLLGLLLWPVVLTPLLLLVSVLLYQYPLYDLSVELTSFD